MTKRTLTLAGAILAAALMSMGVAQRVLAQDDEDMAVVNFLVLKDNNGKPLRNASVVMHPVGKRASSPAAAWS